MIRLFLCVLFSLALTITFGQSINRIDGTKTSVEKIESKIKYLMNKANVSGIAISIFNKNEVVYSKTFGMSDVQKNIPFLPSSIICSASFSKMVFAYVAMQLVDEDVLDLDKPLVEYLDKPLYDYEVKDWIGGYQNLKNDTRYEKITARMCLSHTTGFPNWRFMESDKKVKIKFDPGSRYSYSGEGIHLLQFVIEQIVGKDYEAIAQERVFKPLNMTNTSYIWQSRFDENICYAHNERGEPYEIARWPKANAAGSMNTTLNDFTLFYTAFINHKGLSSSSFDEMTKLQVRIRSKRQFGPLAKVDGDENDKIVLGYGLGVGVMTTPSGKAFFKEGHNEGMGHYSICYTDKEIAVIIMTNNDNGESVFKDLLEYSIGDIYTPWQWEGYIPYDDKN